MAAPNLFRRVRMVRLNFLILLPEQKPVQIKNITSEMPSTVDAEQEKCLFYIEATFCASAISNEVVFQHWIILVLLRPISQDRSGGGFRTWRTGT